MDEMGLTSLFTLFGMSVTPYAVCIAGGALLSVLLLLYLGKKHLGDDSAWSLAALTLPLALIGARAFYILARIPNTPEVLADAPYLWHGGFALWGAVGGAVLAAFLVSRSRKHSFASLLDLMAAPAALMICVARFAEAFSGEGHGPALENEAFCFFPLCVWNEMWEEWELAVFIFEGIAALVILILMLLYKPSRPGDGARKFLILYGACQVLLESLRRDNFLRWLFVRVSQLTAVIIMLLMIICAIVRWTKAQTKAMPKKKLVLYTIFFFLFVGGCIGIEFAVDKSDWPNEILYSLLAVCAAGLGVTTWNVAMKN